MPAACLLLFIYKKRLISGYRFNKIAKNFSHGEEKVLLEGINYYLMCSYDFRGSLKST